MKERLAELDRRELELREALRAVIDERRQVICDAAGISIGSIVKSASGEQYRVAEIKIWRSGKPSVAGNPKRKDGTFGTAIRNLYDNWEVVR